MHVRIQRHERLEEPRQLVHIDHRTAQFSLGKLALVQCTEPQSSQKNEPHGRSRREEEDPVTVNIPGHRPVRELKEKIKKARWYSCPAHQIRLYTTLQDDKWLTKDDPCFQSELDWERTISDVIGDPLTAPWKGIVHLFIVLPEDDDDTETVVVRDPSQVRDDAEPLNLHNYPQGSGWVSRFKYPECHRIDRPDGKTPVPVVLLNEIQCQPPCLLVDVCGPLLGVFGIVNTSAKDVVCEPLGASVPLLNFQNEWLLTSLARMCASLKVAVRELTASCRERMANTNTHTLVMDPHLDRLGFPYRDSVVIAV